LKAAVSRDNQDPFAWYQLGIIYDREGDQARASLASAERLQSSRAIRAGIVSARRCDGRDPAGTPDCLRAQDIVMASQSRAAENKKTKSRPMRTDKFMTRGPKGSDKFSPAHLICRGVVTPGARLATQSIACHRRSRSARC
jgi:hypothetical protein